MLQDFKKKVSEGAFPVSPTCLPLSHCSSARGMISPTQVAGVGGGISRFVHSRPGWGCFSAGRWQGPNEPWVALVRPGAISHLALPSFGACSAVSLPHRNGNVVRSRGLDCVCNRSTSLDWESNLRLFRAHWGSNQSMCLSSLSLFPFLPPSPLSKKINGQYILG